MSKIGAGTIPIYIGDGPHKGQEYIVSSDLNASRVILPVLVGQTAAEYRELTFDTPFAVSAKVQKIDYEIVPRPVRGPDGALVLPVTYIPCDRKLWTQEW